MWTADARIQDAQIVVNLRDRRHCRARIVGAGFLIDGNSRRETGYLIDIGLGHLVQELSRVRRKALDISALSFGKYRIESER